MDAFIQETATKVISTVVAGIVIYAAKLSNRVEVLDARFKDMQHRHDLLVTGHADHDKRIAVIEQVVEDLRELVPAMRSISTLTSKMDAVLETTLKRLEMLENHIYKNS